jgi:hypothetical protein
MATIRYKMGHLEICPIHTTPGASSNVIAFQQLVFVVIREGSLIHDRSRKENRVHNLFSIKQLWPCGQVCRESLPYPNMTERFLGPWKTVLISGSWIS